VSRTAVCWSVFNARQQAVLYLATVNAFAQLKDVPKTYGSTWKEGNVPAKVNTFIELVDPRLLAQNKLLRRKPRAKKNLPN